MICDAQAHFRLSHFPREERAYIVKEVLQTAGCPQADFKIAAGNYPKMGYCVQYVESGYDFICRLLERIGIAWYFKHEEHKHTLVFTDAVSKHEPAKKKRKKMQSALRAREYAQAY